MSNLPAVVMLSMWRNDAKRRLQERVTYLLSKTYPALRWVWIVGDSTDDTEARLRELATKHPAGGRVTIARRDTSIAGEDPESRIRRLSETANAWFDYVEEGDSYCLIHESDLVSSPDVVERLLATGKCPVAGWPVLEVNNERLFYDTWAYRCWGWRFSNRAPYHPCYRPDELFEVDSVGSVWLFYAEDVRVSGPGSAKDVALRPAQDVALRQAQDVARCIDRGALDLCAWMTAHGRSIWVDPTLTILQPTSLWTTQAPPAERDGIYR